MKNISLKKWQTCPIQWCLLQMWLGKLCRLYQNIKWDIVSNQNKATLKAYISEQWNQMNCSMSHLMYTVKPVYNDHPWDTKFVAVVDRWSLFIGRFVL